MHLLDLDVLVADVIDGAFVVVNLWNRCPGSSVFPMSCWLVPLALLCLRFALLWATGLQFVVGSALKLLLDFEPLQFSNVWKSWNWYCFRPLLVGLFLFQNAHLNVVSLLIWKFVVLPDVQWLVSLPRFPTPQEIFYFDRVLHFLGLESAHMIFIRHVEQWLDLLLSWRPIFAHNSRIIVWGSVSANLASLGDRGPIKVTSAIVALERTLVWLPGSAHWIVLIHCRPCPKNWVPTLAPGSILGLQDFELEVGWLALGKELLHGNVLVFGIPFEHDLLAIDVDLLPLEVEDLVGLAHCVENVHI